MRPFVSSDRRTFLGRVTAAIAAVTLARRPLHAAVPAPSRRPGPDDWLEGLTGEHRCFFDFPRHGMGMPLVHMYNYINTYRTAYNVASSECNTIGSLYSVGPESSIPLAFNDTVWSAYRLGEYMHLTDAATGAPLVRNMFYQPRAGDPVFGPSGMANLQRLGAIFLLCENALQHWIGELAGLGKGTKDEVESFLRANIQPGVVTVPAMVIAIEKAQTAGVAYNRQ